MSNPKEAVLACIDGSESSAAVCDYAAWVSRTTGAPVQLLHTFDNEQPPSSDLSGSIGLGAREGLLRDLANIERQRAQLLRESGKQMLFQAQHRCLQAGAADAQTSQRHGSLAETLVDLEDSTRILVLGLRGEAHQHDKKGVGHKLESILRALHRPMLIVNQDFVEPRNVMLAFDGSARADKALQIICDSPLFKQACCHVIYAGADNDGQKHLLHAQTQLEDAGHRVKTAQLDDKLDKAINSYQEQHGIDMIIMGAFSHGRLRELLLGSLTAKVLHNCAKPMLFLR